MLSEFLSTPEGKAELARAMTELLRKRWWCALCRKVVVGRLDWHCQEVGDDAHVIVEVMET